MPPKRLRLTIALLSIGFVIAIIVGVTLGLALATTKNIQNAENLQDTKPALPTQILDYQGRLITQFFSEEKREIVSFDELPKHLIDAILTREDQFTKASGSFIFSKPSWTSSAGVRFAAAAP